MQQVLRISLLTVYLCSVFEDEFIHLRHSILGFALEIYLWTVFAHHNLPLSRLSQFTNYEIWLIFAFACNSTPVPWWCLPGNITAKCRPFPQRHDAILNSDGSPDSKAMFVPQGKFFARSQTAIRINGLEFSPQIKWFLLS